MKNSPSGHHLLRVRMRKSIFEQLQAVAEEESERTGEHITVSEVVRAACSDFLLTHRAVRELEDIIDAYLDALEDDDTNEEGEADDDGEEDEGGEEDDEEEDCCPPVKITIWPMT